MFNNNKNNISQNEKNKNENKKNRDKIVNIGDKKEKYCS